jgi:archaellum component FlaC
MSSEDISSIDEILNHLKDISNQLNIDANMSDTFKAFKEEYYLRNSEVREDLRDLKYDFNKQKDGIDIIQKDVQEMKESFSGFKVEIQPLIEFKQMVSKQVIKYSSVAFFTLVAMTLGINGIAF